MDRIKSQNRGVNRRGHVGGLGLPKRGRREGGFTLVEMMVVIVIIGILAATFVAVTAGRADKAKVQATKAMISQVSGALDLFKMDHNVYPENLDDLAFMPSYVDMKNWAPGGYLKKAPRDGWEREFIYRVNGTPGQLYDIISYGSDGRQGGEAYDEDIWNHDAWKR